MDLPTVGLAPYKTASFKPLRKKPYSAICVPDKLYQIAPTAPEDVDVARPVDSPEAGFAPLPPTPETRIEYR